MQLAKTNIKCLYYDIKRDKCNCHSLKKWYGKPKCVLRVDSNSFCKDMNNL